VTIRSYGALSTTFRKKAGWIEKPPVLNPPPHAKPTFEPLEGERPAVLEEGGLARKRRRNWARLIARTWLCDPELCSSSGQRMSVIAAISSPAQDHVIEKILRSRGEWDPPWKRPRKTRGPPPETSQSQGSSDSQGAPFAESWPEGIDPPHPEDDLDPPFEEGPEG
jgi:hypothetical protein